MPHLVATALAGAALAALLPAVPAGAAVPRGLAVPAAVPPAAADRPTSLRLTLTFPGRQTSGTRGVTLRCDPVGGTHPAAEEACEDLDESEGKITRHQDGRICTTVYSPVLAHAEGEWRGRPVRFTTRYGNECAMRARTGRIFAF
ncbi:SSI family serine proteinase inhibitor [Actinomadura roseirufa]|uniref:SSI family serine proteinase inhibitor n=1 Tax=Actinomadura roseirufa TaxID=2094049 RepID=UPI00104130D1|nr:SSI family serine proteinase inhibitor [Actinomadura roseirufa]